MSDRSCHDRNRSDRRSHGRALTRRNVVLLGAAAGAAASLGCPAQAAVLRFDLNQGNVQPIPIALPDFLAGGAADGEAARGVSQIITANLKRSGLFAPIDPAAFIEKIANVGRAAAVCRTGAPSMPRRWLPAGSPGSPTAASRPNSGCGTCSPGQQLAGQQYFTTPDNWRRIAHIISDADLRAADRRKGLFRQPRRLHRRDRLRRSAASSGSP